jgi:hypothetical protein
LESVQQFFQDPDYRLNDVMGSSKEKRVEKKQLAQEFHPEVPDVLSRE